MKLKPHFTTRMMKKYIPLLLLLPLLVVMSCKDNPERHLKLGNWYFQKGLMDEAILEYREVTRMLPADVNTLSRPEFEMVAKAHYSLALVYTKKGWYDYALSEAETCFKLMPTRENHELVQLIKRRISLGDTAES